MNIAIVASECAPYAKTGGLADVIGALPAHLASPEDDVRVFIPKYSTIDETAHGLTWLGEYGEIPVRVGGLVRSVFLHRATLPGSAVPVFFIDCREFFHRGALYTNDWDEDERWILFSKSVIEAMQRMRWKPDIVHCNDWQTGLMPLLLKDNYRWDQLFRTTGILFTIHNIGYQGRFSPDTTHKAELRGDLFFPGGPLEFNGSFSMMKAGILFADAVSTVSPTYAHEILTEAYGAGMETVLRTRARHLTGVLNGIDVRVWDPASDRHLPFRYSAEDLTGKNENKRYLLAESGLPYDERRPLIGIISRLAAQKGFDTVEGALEELMALDAQWIVLGTGEERYERMFRGLAERYPDRVRTVIGFDDRLAHHIEAGADIFVMPSHYEPCGLNQMYSLRYGTVPVVRKTGGLADTVFDWHERRAAGRSDGNGFTYNDATPFALTHALTRAVDSFRLPEEWRIIQRNGMRADLSWQHSAAEYRTLYRTAMDNRT